MQKKNNLTSRQKDILMFIKKYIAKNNTAPSVRAIALGVHLNSPATVHVHIQNLIDLGYLRRSDKNHKNLELMVPNEFEYREGDAIRVPLIDMYVLKDLEKELQECDEFFYLSSQMIPNGSDVFVVKVPDDKSNVKCISEDDYVIVDKDVSVGDNDIVVAITNEFEIFVDYFKKNSPILSKDRILGKVIGLYREF